MNLKYARVYCCLIPPSFYLTLLFIYFFRVLFLFCLPFPYIFPVINVPLFSIYYSCFFSLFHIFLFFSPFFIFPYTIPVFSPFIHSQFLFFPPLFRLTIFFLCIIPVSLLLASLFLYATLNLFISFPSHSVSSFSGV